MYEFKKIFKRSKCFVALLLSCFLSFGTVTTEYLEVQAFEWIAPAIGIEEAIKYLLMILGVSIGAKTVGDNVDWDTLKQDCITFQENQGNSAVAVSQWWADVLSGKLDQASDCWTSFKQWVSSLVSPSASASSEALVQSILPFCKFDNSLTSSFVPAYAVYYTNNNGEIFAFFFDSSCTYSFDTNGYLVFSNSDSIYNHSYKIYNQPWSPSTTSSISLARSSDFRFSRGAVFGIDNVPYPFTYWDVGNTDSDYKFVYLNPSSINDLQLAISTAISDSIPDVIPLPWDQVAETSDAIQDLIDRLIEQVNEGVLSISDAMVRIQELLGVLTVDTALDGVLVPERPNPDTGEPEKLEDKVKENQDNQGFTLFGLEKVFPFCIPFDIYAFMTLLVAEPVAPVINWPVYNPITQQNEIITIDFSTWNSVVVLFRYIFDFLFIIGLLLMARALIGGGDSA